MKPLTGLSPTAAGLAPLAVYAADPVQGALLGLCVCCCLPAAALLLFVLRALVPAVLLLPLVLTLSCAAFYLAGLALQLLWYPAGTALVVPLALAGGCSAVVLPLRELALRPRCRELLLQALHNGVSLLLLLLAVGLLRVLPDPTTWLELPAQLPSAWSALLLLGLLLGTARARWC